MEKARKKQGKRIKEMECNRKRGRDRYKYEGETGETKREREKDRAWDSIDRQTDRRKKRRER